MELDSIKLETTWNDAAGSLNNNFAKLKQAIALGSLGNVVMLDTEMSETSESAVQNKVIKAYVDQNTQQIRETLQGIEATLNLTIEKIEEMEEATIQPLYDK